MSHTCDCLQNKLPVLTSPIVQLCSSVVVSTVEYVLSIRSTVASKDGSVAVDVDPLLFVYVTSTVTRFELSFGVVLLPDVDWL